MSGVPADRQFAHYLLPKSSPDTSIRSRIWLNHYYPAGGYPVRVAGGRDTDSNIPSSVV